MALTELVATTLGFGSLTQMIGAALAPKYGIYAKTIDTNNKNPLNLKEGDEVFIPSSWVKHELIAESSISTAPTESGGYTSFNKVMRPAELRVVFTVEGWMAFDGNMEMPFTRASLSRSRFIEKLTNMRKYAYTYSIVTPDATYPSFDLTHFDFQVSSNNGVTLLIVNAFFQKINQTLESSVSSNLKNSGTTNTQAGKSNASMNKIQNVNSSIKKSTGSLLDQAASIAKNPISNIRSAAATVSRIYSNVSNSPVEAIKIIAKGIM